MVTQPGPKVQKKKVRYIRSICMWLDLAMIMIYDLRFIDLIYLQLLTPLCYIWLLACL